MFYDTEALLFFRNEITIPKIKDTAIKAKETHSGSLIKS
jgi:hypothetical protein